MSRVIRHQELIVLQTGAHLKLSTSVGEVMEVLLLGPPEHCKYNLVKYIFLT